MPTRDQVPANLELRGPGPGDIDIEFYRRMPGPRPSTVYPAADAQEIPLLAFNTKWTPDQLWEVLEGQDAVMSVPVISSAHKNPRPLKVESD